MRHLRLRVQCFGFFSERDYSFDSAVLGRPLAIPKLIALFNIKLSETPPSGKATKVLNLAADGLLDGYVITIDFSDSGCNDWQSAPMPYPLNDCYEADWVLARFTATSIFQVLHTYYTDSECVTEPKYIQL
jgi:hypothetical protein